MDHQGEYRSADQSDPKVEPIFRRHLQPPLQSRLLHGPREAAERTEGLMPSAMHRARLEQTSGPFSRIDIESLRTLFTRACTPAGYIR
jgi:hypothetical protein